MKTKIDGTGWVTYGSTGSGDHQFGTGAIHYDQGSGDLYIADWDNHRIIRTQFGGAGWTILGDIQPSSGSGAYEFWSPEGISFRPSSGYVYVADTGNSRLIMTKMDHSTWTDWNGFPITGLYDSPRGLSIDQSSGFIYFADTGNNRIVKSKASVSEEETYGTSGSGIGQFSYPSDVFFDSMGTYASNGYLI